MTNMVLTAGRCWAAQRTTFHARRSARTGWTATARSATAPPQPSVCSARDPCPALPARCMHTPSGPCDNLLSCLLSGECTCRGVPALPADCQHAQDQELTILIPQRLREVHAHRVIEPCSSSSCVGPLPAEKTVPSLLTKQAQSWTNVIPDNDCGRGMEGTGIKLCAVKFYTFLAVKHHNW